MELTRRRERLHRTPIRRGTPKTPGWGHACKAKPSVRDVPVSASNDRLLVKLPGLTPRAADGTAATEVSDDDHQHRDVENPRYCHRDRCMHAIERTVISLVFRIADGVKIEQNVGRK